MRYLLALLLLYASTAYAEDSRFFGLQVGEQFKASTCTSSSPTTELCIYSATTLEPNGAYSYPIYVPSRLLPSYVQPGSVRVIVDQYNTLHELKFSLLNGNGSRGSAIFYGFRNRFGKSVYTKLSETSFNLHWDLTDKIVDVDAFNTKSEILGTVSISAKGVQR